MHSIRYCHVLMFWGCNWHTFGYKLSIKGPTHYFNADNIDIRQHKCGYESSYCAISCVFVLSVQCTERIFYIFTSLLWRIQFQEIIPNVWYLSCLKKHHPYHNVHTAHTQRTGRMKWNDKWIEFWNFKQILYIFDYHRCNDIPRNCTIVWHLEMDLDMWMVWVCEFVSFLDTYLSKMKHVLLRSNNYEHLHLVLKSNEHMHIFKYNVYIRFHSIHKP